MAIYHLNVSTGSRGGGQSAGAKSDYIEREGKYKDGKEEVLHVEHDNMPEWAQDNPGEYWRAADEFERANARLFRQVEFALPIELSADEQIALAHEFAQSITADEKLPYTLAIHRGEFDHRGNRTDTPDNPHVHLIISERANDGIERTPETWFKRANKKDPSKGGAAKTKSLESRDWLCETREQWQEFANKALERSGHDARIDHRTLEAQGIDRIPQVHRGASQQMHERGISTERYSRSVEISETNSTLAAMSHDQALLDKQISELSREILLTQARIRREKEREKEKVREEKQPHSAEIDENSAEYKRTEQVLLEIKRDLEKLDKTTLMGQYEQHVKEYREIDAQLHNLPHIQNKLNEKLEAATARARASYDTVEELSGKMFGKMRYKKEIAQATADNRRDVKIIKETEQALEKLPSSSDLIKQRNIQDTMLELTGAVIESKAAQERKEKLKDAPPAVREHWNKAEKRLKTFTQRTKHDVINYERGINSQFVMFQQNIEHNQGRVTKEAKTPQNGRNNTQSRGGRSR